MRAISSRAMSRLGVRSATTSMPAASLSATLPAGLESTSCRAAETSLVEARWSGTSTRRKPGRTGEAASAAGRSPRRSSRAAWAAWASLTTESVRSSPERTVVSPCSASARPVRAQSCSSESAPAGPSGERSVSRPLSDASS